MKTFLVALLLFSLFGSLSASCAKTTPIDRPTSYHQMVIELGRDAQRSQLIHLTTIGHSAKRKVPIYMVQIGQPGPKKTTIMILCRQHGDEPSGTEAAIRFIAKMSSAPDAASLMASSCLFIVPMVNPDGADAETRLNGVKADLNRDWGIFAQPETAAVKRAVRNVRPQFILDIHSWDMIDPFQQVCLEGPRQAPSTPGLLLATADLQARAAYALSTTAKTKVAATTYGVYSEGTLAHRYFLEHDHLASLLFETGPGANYGSSLESRTNLVDDLLNWLVKDTTLHQDAWARLIAAEPKLPPISEPTTKARVSAPTQVLNTPVIAVGSASRLWPPLIAGCIIIGWIALKGRRRTDSLEIGFPARRHRLQNVSMSEGPLSDTGEHRESRRHAAAKASLLLHLKNGNRIRLSAGLTKSNSKLRIGTFHN